MGCELASNDSKNLRPWELLVCLALLVFDFGRRWGRPRLYVDLRSPLTYVATGLMVAAIVIVNIID